MSDHFIRFIPVDPHFIPAKKAQKAALALFRAAAPKAADIFNDAGDAVLFRDAGANFERVRCPRCGTDVASDAWAHWMDADHAGEAGFRLEPVTTPCCRHRATLNELVYEWPQGFSRYALGAKNIGKKLPATLVTRLEQALGCRLRVIRQRL